MLNQKILVRTAHLQLFPVLKPQRKLAIYKLTGFKSQTPQFHSTSNMAKLQNEIPSLKLNDGTKIPMVSQIMRETT